MLWREVREWGEQALWLPLEAKIKVDLDSELLADRRWRRIALEAVQAQMVHFGASLAQTFLSTRDLISTFAHSPLAEEPLIPWLPMSTSPIGSVPIQFELGGLSGPIDLDRRLKGQRFKGSLRIAAFTISAYPQIEVRPIAVVINTIELDESSFWAKVTGGIKILLVYVPLAVSVFSSPQIQEQIQDWKFSQELAQVAQGQRCESYADWQVDLEVLRSLGPETLNYADPQISEGERALRICNVQLALRVAQGSPRLIDGILGEDTNQALRDYASQKRLNSSIENETLRASLLRELQGYH